MPRRPIRFLHLADIHLGCNQYGSVERERDFFYAFESAVKRFALPVIPGGKPQVDFVLIAGDLFDKQQIQPVTLSHATAVLSMLREASIPVFAMEGNHDTFRKEDKQNWYQYLCGEQLLFFLRDEIHDREIALLPWDEDENRGSYCDIGPDIRIIGTRWYGSAAQTMVEKLASALAKLDRKPLQIMMFHGGLIDHIGGASAGVEYEAFLPLRDHVDYLALGHVHKEYNRQNWLFNPGCLEVSKSDEFEEAHGAYVITWNPESREIEAEHRRDYLQRPVIQITVWMDRWATPDEAKAALPALLSSEIAKALHHTQGLAWWSPAIERQAAICHVYLRGGLAFAFSEIPWDALKDELLASMPLFLLRWHNDTTPLELILPDLDPDDTSADRRSRFETRFFVESFQQIPAYAPLAEGLANFASNLKSAILKGEIDTSTQTIDQTAPLFQSLRSLLRSVPNEPSIPTSQEPSNPRLDPAALLSAPLSELLHPNPAPLASPKRRKRTSEPSLLPGEETAPLLASEPSDLALPSASPKKRRNPAKKTE